MARRVLMPAVDLNADLGEGFGQYTVAGADAVLPLVTSANIACGFHAGDPRTIDAAVDMAKRHGVQVGAHPGFPDRVGFGRRMMTLRPEEITTDVVYQIGAAAAFCRRHRVPLRHVKAHGALGTLAWRDRAAADAVLNAVESVDPTLIVLALTGSVLEHRALERGLRMAREAFLDRAYRPDATLVPRSEPGAVLHDEQEIVRRARRMVTEGTVAAIDGTVLEVHPDTLCVHGDTAGAANLIGAVRRGLEADGVDLRALDKSGTQAPAAASVHEAAGRRGALPSRIKPVAPSMRLRGPAFPVRCPSGDNLWLHRAIAAARPGEILVADVGGEAEFGYWGEIMSRAALARGLAGLVIDGGVRDVYALAAMGLPIFSHGVCVQGTGKDPVGDGAVGEPVTIGGTAVRRGDLVVGDADGVVVVPARDADRVVAAARLRDRMEEQAIARLDAGETTLEIYGLGT